VLLLVGGGVTDKTLPRRRKRSPASSDGDQIASWHALNSSAHLSITQLGHFVSASGPLHASPQLAPMQPDTSFNAALAVGEVATRTAASRCRTSMRPVARAGSVAGGAGLETVEGSAAGSRRPFRTGLRRPSGSRVWMQFLEEDALLRILDQRIVIRDVHAHLVVCLVLPPGRRSPVSSPRVVTHGAHVGALGRAIGVAVTGGVVPAGRRGELGCRRASRLRRRGRRRLPSPGVLVVVPKDHGEVGAVSCSASARSLPAAGGRRCTDRRTG